MINFSKKNLIPLIPACLLLFLTIPATLHAGKGKTFKAQPASRIVTLTAFTRPRVQMTLVSEESARCTHVYADRGDTIPASGLFAKLDPTFIRLDIVRLKADREKLQADVDYYSKEVGRYSKLVSKNTAAQSELDAYLRDLKRAKAQLRSVKTELNINREHLTRYTLRAPSGWKVIDRYIEPGEWVNKGEKVAELGNFNTLLVPFAFTVDELEKVRSLGDITLHLPDLDQDVKAGLERVSPDFDPETRKINVDLEINSGDFNFRGGIRAELNLEMPDSGGSVLVPQSSLVKAYDDWFLVRPDGVRVKVLLLGTQQGNMSRVSSRAVKPGQEFLLKP